MTARLAPGAVLAVAVAGMAAAATPAVAVEYPPPSPPPRQTDGPPTGPFRTLRVCHGRRACFPRIQDAVNEARPGETIRVAAGTWRESVRITGRGKRRVRLIGDPQAPGRVILDARRPGRRLTHGVVIHGADAVTVDGFTIRGYADDGVVAAAVRGVTLTHLAITGSGQSGLLTFGAIGATLADLVVTGNAAAGVAITQTPPQGRVAPTTVTRLLATGNGVGLAGANARYVVLTASQLSGNGSGVVLASTAGEVPPPAEQNVITTSDILNNNLAVGSSPTPDVPSAQPGTGVLLVGAQLTTVTANRIIGNQLAAVVEAAQPALGAAGEPSGNELGGNEVG